MTSLFGTIGLAIAAVGSGIMAGVYFAFSTFIMRSLSMIRPAEAIVSMQSINTTILSSLFMPVFFGTTVISVGSVAWSLTHWDGQGTAAMLGAGLLYFFGMFVCTVVFNVPLNNALDAVDISGTAATKVWSNYLRSWTFWNHVRTVASVLSCALYIVATLMFSKS